MYSLPFKKHYIISTAIATVIAIVVWFFVPKEYAAKVKLSDEYKETDLAVGLTKMAARMRSAGSQNEGINNIETYAKILSTEDFLKAIEETKIPGKDITYGSWAIKQKRLWQTTDTFELVKDKLSFNVSRKQQTLYIQFKDADPVVASKMLDIVVKNLQATITDARRKSAESYYHYLLKERTRAEKEYREAQNNYASLKDSHHFVHDENVKTRIQKMENDVSMKYKAYRIISEQCSREHALMQKAAFSFAVIKSNTVPIESDSYPVVYIAAFVILGLLLTKGYLLYQERNKHEGIYCSLGDIFAPWNVTFGIWALIIIFAQSVGDLIYPIKNQFYYGISLWLPIFCLVSWVTYTLLKPSAGRVDKKTFVIKYSNLVFNIFLTISILCTPLCVKKVMDIIMMFGTEDLMYNMRVLAIKGETGLGILAYCFTINKALLILAFWRYPNIKKWQLALVIILFAMNAFVDMDKGSIFFIAITAIFVLYQRGKISIRGIAFFGIALVLIFFVFTIMRTETGDDGKGALDDLTILEFIGIYVLTTPVAFSYMQPNIGAPYGSYTLTTVYLILNKLGGNFPIIEQIQEFVWVPLPTNLYTIMQPFFLDFGYPGIAFFAVLYGVVCGWAYRSYRNGSSTGCVMYTYLLYYIVLQFSQEGLIMLPVFTMRMVFCLFLLTQNKFSLSFKK